MVLITIDFVKTILQKIKDEFKKYVPMNSANIRRPTLTGISNMNDLTGEIHAYYSESQQTIANLPVSNSYGFIDTFEGYIGNSIKIQKVTVIGVIGQNPYAYPVEYIRYGGANGWQNWTCIRNDVNYLKEHAIQDTNT